jgi:tetratricopeptide (TPR) repeat protein
MLKNSFTKSFVKIAAIFLILSASCLGQEAKTPDCAGTDFDCRIKANPDDSMLYFKRGFILYNRGKNEAALEDLNKSIELDPNSGIAYYIRGLIYYSTNRLKEAVVEFTKSIEIDPLNSETYYYRGLCYLDGDLFEKDEKTDKAIKDFDQAIEKNLTRSVYFFKRGDAYLRKENFNQAIEEYSKAIIIESIPSYYHRRAVAYEKIGEKDKASQDYKTYEELSKKK